MKTKLPCQEYLKSLFNYDAETGKLFWNEQKAYKIEIGSEVGWMTDRGYKKTQIDGQCFAVHRIIWKLINGFDPDTVDHINGNKNDNRIINLRSVSQKENQKNRMIHGNNTSGVIGVSWYKSSQKWRVQINVNLIKKTLGYFDNKKDAILCRKNAEKENNYHLNHGRVSA